MTTRKITAVSKMQPQLFPLPFTPRIMERIRCESGLLQVTSYHDRSLSAIRLRLSPLMIYGIDHLDIAAEAV